MYSTLGCFISEQRTKISAYLVPIDIPVCQGRRYAPHEPKRDEFDL